MSIDRIFIYVGMSFEHIISNLKKIEYQVLMIIEITKCYRMDTKLIKIQSTIK